MRDVDETIFWFPVSRFFPDPTKSFQIRRAAMYLCFQDVELFELPHEKIEEACQIRHIRALYGTKNYEDKVYGSKDCPIRFSTVNHSEFMIILQFLKLKQIHGDPFVNKYITHHSLVHYDWSLQFLIEPYVKTVEEMSTESIVTCMCTCSTLSLFDLRQLFIYRLIYLLNKSFDTIAPTMECLVKNASAYDIMVFQKASCKLIDEDSKSNERSDGQRERSQSF